MFRALNGIGDLLCAVPALRALRRAFADADIVLIGHPSARPFVERFSSYLDGLVEFPGAPGLPERPFDAGATTRFLADVQAQPFDLALQMHGSGLYSNAFVASLGATACAGFHLPGLYSPDPDLFFAYPHLEHEIYRNLLLLENLGIGSEGDYIDWPVTNDDRAEFDRLRHAFGLDPASYACIHPGARDPRRQWSLENFGRVATALAQRGLTVCVTGAASEEDLTEAVNEHSDADVIDLTGQTSLGGLAQVIANARVVVSNDTGVSHIAAAVFAPSVVVFVASDPARWAPLDRSIHLAVGNGMPDRDPADPHDPARCLLDGCMLPGRLGTRHPRPPAAEQVIEAVDQLLRSEEMIAGVRVGEGGPGPTDEGGGTGSLAAVE